MTLDTLSPSRLLHKLSPKILGVSVWLLLLGGTTLALSFLYLQSSRYYMEVLHEHIGDVAIIAAEVINLEAHEQLVSSEQMNSQLYIDTLAPLVKFHLSYPNVNYVYTMREVQNVEYFVLDTTTNQAVFDHQTEINHPPRPSQLLEEYAMLEFDEVDLAMREGQTFVYDQPFEDNFGTFITAHTPLFDSEENYLGYLGIDYDLAIFNKKLASLRASGLWAIFLAMIISTILARLATRLRQQSIDTIQQLEIAEHNLRLQKEKAEQASQEKSDLLAIASHDLKNPLAAIAGLSTLALEITKADEKQDGQAIEFLQNINDASIHMSEVVKGILENEGLEHQGLSIIKEEVSLNLLIKLVLDFNEKLAKQKNIQIEVQLSEDISIIGDKTRLREAFDNYINNAVKYSPKNKTITVSLKITDDKQHIEFRVSDQGPGLTDKDKSKLFNKFQKLSAKPTAGESSTGLGLSIVKTIIELHGGEVGCDSETGKGASFWVLIPNEIKT